MRTHRLAIIGGDGVNVANPRIVRFFFGFKLAVPMIDIIILIVNRFFLTQLDAQLIQLVEDSFDGVHIVTVFIQQF